MILHTVPVKVMWLKKQSDKQRGRGEPLKTAVKAFCQYSDNFLVSLTASEKDQMRFKT